MLTKKKEKAKKKNIELILSVGLLNLNCNEDKSVGVNRDEMATLPPPVHLVSHTCRGFHHSTVLRRYFVSKWSLTPVVIKK
jgi:hypothetical protein